jgi:Flp pilus assembly protein TadD
VARNPLNRPAGRRPGRKAPQGDAPKRSIGAIPIVTTLLVVGALCAAGIAWMAPTPLPQDDLTAPASTASSRPPAPSEPETPPPAPEPAAPAFLDPAGAGALAYAGGDYERALAEYQAAIERNPDDAESHSNLGQMLVRLKRVKEAIPHFDRAVALLPQRWAYHFNRARALALLERWDEAIAGYRTAQQLFPNDYATAFNLAQTLHRKGDESAAVDQYRRAIELNPSDATFHLALGISYERLQKPVEAAAAYTEYLVLLPAAPNAEQVRARIAQLTGAS